jgi:uncharacterized protein (DUF2384 family)
MKEINVLVTVIDFESDEEKRVLKAVVDTGMKEEDAKEWLKEWLVTKIPSLGWAKPYTLLNTEEGIDRVIHVALALIYGVYL